MFDYNSAARKDHGINREDVIVLCVRKLHQNEEDDEGEGQNAPSAVAQKPDQSRDPDWKQDWVDVDDLLFDESERAER